MTDNLFIMLIFEILRLDNIFSIIVDFPASLPAIEDLKVTQRLMDALFSL